VLSHTITSPAMPDVDAAVSFWNEHGTSKLTQRTPEQLLRFFDGLELLEPGIVSCSRWRSEITPWGEPAEVAMFGGVGRKTVWGGDLSSCLPDHRPAGQQVTKETRWRN
jgi:hypothetical protein